MIDWILGQIQTFATLGFCFGLAAIVALVFVAWRYQTTWALRYAGALALPVLFFLLFTFFVGSIRFFAWWFAATLFWSSLLLTLVCAALGFAQRKWRALFVSAMVSIPFAFSLFLSPGTRLAILIPLLLLACAGILRWFTQRAEQNIVPYKFQ